MCQRPFLLGRCRAGRVLGDDQRGHDWPDPARLLRAAPADQGDRADAVGVTRDGAQGYPAQGRGQRGEPNIPPKVNRRWKNCFSPFLYRDRNAIERMFGRLKDFRRIATRYDRSATNFLAAVCLAATVSYWL